MVLLNIKKENVLVKRADLRYYHYKKNWNNAQRQMFKEVGEELIAAEILATIDIPVLERLIELRFQIEKINSLINVCEDTKELKSLMTMQNNLLNQVLKLEQDLGLTPRSRLILTPTQERQDYDYEEDFEVSDDWDENL